MKPMGFLFSLLVKILVENIGLDEGVGMENPVSLIMTESRHQNRSSQALDNS